MRGATASESTRHGGDAAARARRRRILAVGNMYPPHHTGGYELAWQAAMREARRHGHDVRVLVSDYRATTDAGEADPDIHRTLSWYWDPDRYEFPRLGVADRLRLERRNAAELRRHLREFRPDVVTWWSMGCMSLALIEQARRTGLPAVFVVHDDWLVYGWQHDQWIRTWQGPRRSRLAPLVQRTCGIPARVDIGAAGPLVFNSQSTLERARQTGIGLPVATVVHPGIDATFLSARTPRPWRWRLAYVGRIDRQKGIDTAVRALADLPTEATLAVWGTGDERYVAELRALADGLGVGERLRFEGFAARDQLPAVYEDADAVVFPVRWEEPFGLVPLEAMGIGRPVVTTARGGTAEFIRDGENALVFAADDSAALAAALHRLAGDEGLRARLRDGGLHTAAEHTVERYARLTVEEILIAAGRVRR